MTRWLPDLSANERKQWRLPAIACACFITATFIYWNKERTRTTSESSGGQRPLVKKLPVCYSNSNMHSSIQLLDGVLKTFFFNLLEKQKRQWVRRTVSPTCISLWITGLSLVMLQHIRCSTSHGSHFVSRKIIVLYQIRVFPTWGVQDYRWVTN